MTCFRLGRRYISDLDPVIVAVPCRGDALARALRASASAHHVELWMEVLGWTGWFREQLFRAKSDSFKMGVGD